MAPQRSMATGHAQAANGQHYGNQYNKKLSRHDSLGSEERFFCPPPEPQLVPQNVPKRKETLRPEPLQMKELYVVKVLADDLDKQETTVAVRIKRHGTKHRLDRENSVLSLRLMATTNVRATENGKVHDEDRMEYRNADLNALQALPWNPFVANLIAAFSDTANLCILHDVAPFGTLAQYLDYQGHMPSAMARFYFANITLGLEFIHSHGIMHRDIKPENIFINGDGYLMISNFSVAAKIDNEYALWEDIGTTVYAPPEMRGAGNYGAAVYNRMALRRTAMDWWGAAVTLYEMLTNIFCTDDKELFRESVKMIQNGTPLWPDEDDEEFDIHPAVKHLVKKMLNPDLKKRFGTSLMRMHSRSMRRGKKVEEEVLDKVVLQNLDIRTHPFMVRFDWEKCERRMLVAPYWPTDSSTIFDWHGDGTLEEHKELLGTLKIEEPPSPFKYDRVPVPQPERMPDSEYAHLLPRGFGH